MIFASDFPESALCWVYQATFMVDIEVCLMIFQRYIDWYFDHRFKSVFYLKSFLRYVSLRN